MRLLWIAAGVVLLDQATKIMVLQTMYRGQSIPLLGDWLKLTFTENPGMAFGISFGPPGMVTAFSVLATLLIIVYLYRVRSGYTPYRASLALILGGAVGNIIDRMFYGMLFSGGRFFQGHVVDFIHVNVWRGYVPDAIPMFGGKYVALFPIWNVADMAIVLGVVGILFFQKAFHAQLAGQHHDETAEVPVNGLTTAREGEGSPAEAPAPLWTPPPAGEGSSSPRQPNR